MSEIASAADIGKAITLAILRFKEEFGCSPYTVVVLNPPTFLSIPNEQLFTFKRIYDCKFYIMDQPEPYRICMQ